MLKFSSRNLYLNLSFALFKAWLDLLACLVVEKNLKAECRLCELHEIILYMLPVVDIKCDFMQVEILRNVQFRGETLSKFRQKVSVFSKWARHRGDVWISKGVVSGFGKIRGGSFQLVSEL